MLMNLPSGFTGKRPASPCSMGKEDKLIWMAYAYNHGNDMQQGHKLLVISLLLVASLAAAGCMGTSPVSNPTATANATPTPVPANYDVKLTSDKDYLYLSLPACGADDTMTVTAQVYENGQPAKAGVPVTFKLNDERFARIGQSQVQTNDNGTASVTVSAQQSTAYPTTYPYNLTITATANGDTGSLTTPMSRHVSLSGNATNKEGDRVSGATVTLLFNATGIVVRAPGNPATTDLNGHYNFTCLPVDMGNINLAVQKGSLSTVIPVNLTTISREVP
jgi:hypothetical protein